MVSGGVYPKQIKSESQDHEIDNDVNTIGRDELKLFIKSRYPTTKYVPKFKQNPLYTYCLFIKHIQSLAGDEN